jgi:photosystem II stability/assembly factor-like uncharacterized protein
MIKLKKMKFWKLTLIVLLTVSIKVHAQCDSTFFRLTGTYLNKVALIDTNRMVAVGDKGLIIRTIDGGQHWQNVPTNQSTILTCIQLFGDSIGYAAGYDRTILKTEDGGKSWFSIDANVVSGSFNPNFNYNGLFFLNSNKGFIYGHWGQLVSTEDGGKSWKDTTFEEGVYCMDFVNDSVGFLGGASGTMFKTTDTAARGKRLS